MIGAQASPESLWQIALHDPVALATVLLVVVTAGLWVFTGLLWRATVNLAKDAKDAADTHAKKMERSVAEAANAARAMGETNEIARDTAYRQLRAYVSPHKASMEVWYENELINFRLLGSVTNNGLTPATITDERFCVSIVNGSGAGAETRGMNEIVAPRSLHTFSIEVATQSPPEEKAIKFNVGYLFTYSDYLGNPWTEAMWWNSDRMTPTARSSKQTLTLSKHISGPDKELRWTEDEWAEIEARAKGISTPGEQRSS